MKGKLIIVIMQTIHNIRTNLDCRPAYTDNFQMTPTPVALVVARAPAQPPAIVEGSETTGHLQRARKIPDYRSAYIGNFQMALRTLGVEGSGAMNVYSNKS